MRLDSVLELKQRLSTMPGEAHSILKKGATAFADGLLSTAGPRSGVSLGVAAGEGTDDFRLAVRTFRRTRAVVEHVDAVTQAARGEVDVAHVGTIHAIRRASALTSKYEARVRPLEAGYSIAHRSVTAGTIGAFVSDATGIIGTLSNNHVLAATNAGRRGDDVLQPSPSDQGRRPKDVVGWLENFVPLSAGARNEVDAAFAAIDAAFEISPGTYAGRNLLGVRTEPLQKDTGVWKIGRTTGVTRGVVKAFALDDVPVRYGSSTYLFDDQVEVMSETSPFSRGGDSGSLILDEANHAIALLFAGSTDGGPYGTGRTYANPIATVLARLRLTLLLE